MRRGTGGVVARRAVVRWALRLFRRDWRQQVLVLGLLTLTSAAAVFAGTLAYNLVPSRDAELGHADHRFQHTVSDPDALDAYVADAEEWFGTAEVVGHRDVPVPGSAATVEVRSQEPNGPTARPCST